MERTIKRNRILYLALIGITILLGLFSRSAYFSEPQFIKEFSGDSLWALMVFWGFGFIFKNTSPWRIALMGLVFCYGIELSQLYHAPWIDAIRNNRLGGLVLGYGFKATDLICYAVGISFGCLAEMLLGVIKYREAKGYKLPS